MMIVPPPPDGIVSISSDFVEHAAPWMYWLLTITHFLIWWVLHWQRIGGETYAARAFRRFILSKAWLWLALALGRSIAPDWRVVSYALVVVYVAFATIAALVALFLTYVWPEIQWRRRKGPRPQPREGNLM